MIAGIVIGILLTIATLATVFFAVVYTKYKTPPLERGEIVEVDEEDFWKVSDTRESKLGTADIERALAVLQKDHPSRAKSDPIREETPIIPIGKSQSTRPSVNRQAEQSKKKSKVQRRKKNKIARKSRKINRKK